MSDSSSIQRGGRISGNREVARLSVLASRGDASGAGTQAYQEEEGGSEAKPRDAVQK
jgi:hypothetical protein